MKKLLLLLALLLIPSASFTQPRISIIGESEGVAIGFDVEVVREEDIVVTDVYMFLERPAVSPEEIVFNVTIDLYAVHCKNHLQAIRKRKAYLDRELVAEIDMGGEWFSITPGTAGAALEQALCAPPREQGIIA